MFNLDLTEDVREIVNTEKYGVRNILFTYYCIKHRRNRKIRTVLYLSAFTLGVVIGNKLV